MDVSVQVVVRKRELTRLSAEQAAQPAAAAHEL
jgi:hypothetical protein